MGVNKLLRNAGRCSTSTTMLLQNRGTKVTQNLKLGPLFSSKKLNCKSWSFWIENDVKTLGKERELRDAQSSGAVSFLAF